MMYGLDEELNDETQFWKERIKELEKERDTLQSLNQSLQKENRELREQLNILFV